MKRKRIKVFLDPEYIRCEIDPPFSGDPPMQVGPFAITPETITNLARLISDTCYDTDGAYTCAFESAKDLEKVKAMRDPEFCDITDALTRVYKHLDKDEVAECAREDI